METNQLKTFYEIVRTGSYSKASKNLFITQSAVSHQIKNLEKELNVKLFERLRNMMKLTEGGKILANAVGMFLNELDNLKRITEEVSNSKAGTLTIATTNGITLYVLPDVIKKFTEQFPQIKIKLINRGRYIEFLPLLLDGEVDLVLGPKSSQITSTKVKFLVWKSFSRVLLMSKDHPLGKKRTIKLVDVSMLPLILYVVGSETREAVDGAFAREKLHNEPVMEIDIAASSKKYVEMGIGASILGSFQLTEEDRRKFQCVDVSHLFGKVEYVIYYRRTQYFTAAMKQFISLLSPDLS